MRVHVLAIWAPRGHFRSLPDCFRGKNYLCLGGWCRVRWQIIEMSSSGFPRKPIQHLSDLEVRGTTGSKMPCFFRSAWHYTRIPWHYPSFRTQNLELGFRNILRKSINLGSVRIYLCASTVWLAAYSKATKPENHFFCQMATRTRAEGCHVEPVLGGGICSEVFE